MEINQTKIILIVNHTYEIIFFNNHDPLRTVKYLKKIRDLKDIQIEYKGNLVIINKQILELFNTMTHDYKFDRSHPDYCGYERWKKKDYLWGQRSLSLSKDNLNEQEIKISGCQEIIYFIGDRKFTSDIF